MLTCGKKNQANYFLVCYENQVCSSVLIAPQLGTDCAALHMQCFSLLNSPRGPGAAHTVICTSENTGWLETMNQLEIRGLTELHHEALDWSPHVRASDSPTNSPEASPVTSSAIYMLKCVGEHPEWSTPNIPLGNFCEEMQIAHI